jgi:hypothetical protein
MINKQIFYIISEEEEGERHGTCVVSPCGWFFAVSTIYSWGGLCQIVSFVVFFFFFFFFFGSKLVPVYIFGLTLQRHNTFSYEYTTYISANQCFILATILV